MTEYMCDNGSMQYNGAKQTYSPNDFKVIIFQCVHLWDASTNKHMVLPSGDNIGHSFLSVSYLFALLWRSFCSVPLPIFNEVAYFINV